MPARNDVADLPVDGTQAPPGTADPDPKRWWALAIIAVAQLMVVLDASIVTIALPSAQHSLHLSTDSRQWVVTAYTLTFGSLLLLGGRIADFLGRKRMFLVGLLGFAGSSALGGLAVNGAMLFGARALQGAFAALLAPAALSLITVTFTEPRERATAFGVYGGISGGGAAIGLVMGGLLTEYASWRWCLLVNTPIAIAAAIAAIGLVREHRLEGTAHYDIPGVVTVTAGLASLVYGFTKAASDGWAAPATLAFLGAAALLLVVFVAIEIRSTHALLPLRIVLDRTRGGSLLASFFVGAGLLGMFLFLTYYFQSDLGYSALTSGFAFLPFSGGIILAAGLSSKLLPRIGPRPIMVAGFAAAALGILLLSRVGPHASFAGHILPSELLISLGMGLAFVPMSSTALVGVDGDDAGVASAALNASQQVGGSLGTALVNTVAASATAAFLVVHPGTSRTAIDAAQVHGYSMGYLVGAGCLAAAAVVSAVLINASRKDLAAAGEVLPAVA